MHEGASSMAAVAPTESEFSCFTHHRPDHDYAFCVPRPRDLRKRVRPRPRSSSLNAGSPVAEQGPHRTESDRGGPFRCHHGLGEGFPLSPVQPVTRSPTPPAGCQSSSERYRSASPQQETSPTRRRSSLTLVNKSLSTSSSGENFGDKFLSPFRRELFKSISSRRNMLVDRITDQKERLSSLYLMGSKPGTPLPGTPSPSTPRPSSPVRQWPSRDPPEEGGIVQGLASSDSGSDSCLGDSSAQFLDHEELTIGSLLLESLRAEALGPRKEQGNRVSICDSGIGVEDEENSSVSSLSRVSSRASEFDLDCDALAAQLEVLCGNRVSQMTRTYNDIDAVTRLLEEKEKDLELAAKIGQQLLARNKGLEERNVALEAEISAAGDTITQLKHDLQMKTDLLQIYTNDVDDSSVDSTPTGVRLFNVEVLQHRVQNLEVENKSLRQEASQLASDTFDCESKEKELVHDVIRQLSDANVQVRQLSDELAKKVEDSLRQQEEITQLLAQVVDFQAANKRLVSENEELANMVQVARECQQELTTELAELKEKYAEVLDLLHDTQDQLRRVQKKNLPGSRGHYLGNLYSSSPFNSGSDSIANELTSLNSIGEEMSKVDGNSSMRRAFDTVRLTGRQAGIMSYSGSIHSTPTHQAQTLMGTPTHHGIQSSGSAQGYVPSYLSRPSSVYSSCSGHPSLDSGADSDASMHTDSEDNYPASHTGVPGWPGTQDLEFCIKRLGPGGRANTPSQFLPYGCRTPDSIMSTGGSGKSGMSSSGSSRNADWRYPQKLQIVKPIEGSLTLHQWSRLATPHLGGLLEEREGVAIKGSTTQDLNLDVYSMSDLEEDEAQEDNPGKQFMSTSGIYTFTNSTVLHPDDQTSLTPSIQKAQVSVLPTNEAPGTPTPSRGPSCPPSRRGSTATFSTNVGLAKHLNERGIASLSSGYTPTATPANSPEGTRPGSPEPAGIKIPGFDELHKTFSYGAKMLRRTIYGEESKPPSPTVAPRINLVERVQEIGVDRFVGHTGHGALTVGGVVTSRPATSPLLHLSSLIMSSAKTTSTTMSGSSSLTSTSTTASNKFSSIMSTPKIPSPGERRPAVPQGAPLGIPGHPGSGHLDSRLSQLKPGQRADLGTVGSSGRRPRPTTLGSVPGKAPPSQDQNLGTVGWMSLGRKGGLL
ncbi:trafficking kinesin-binding protein milt isoform X4 [Oratosquilla oratoria]|uniref:trafficking kinesin-binding protein milt isoform X4 n=1 Tax=Oratosquilla oratoria TaxID=337810 RepID=UPI003F76D2B3